MRASASTMGLEEMLMECFIGREHVLGVNTAALKNWHPRPSGSSLLSYTSPMGKNRASTCVVVKMLRFLKGHFFSLLPIRLHQTYEPMNVVPRAVKRLNDWGSAKQDVCCCVGCRMALSASFQKSGTGRLFPDGLISSTSLSLFLPNFSDDDKWEASWLHNDTRKIKRCFHFFSHCFSREWELLCTITFPTPAQKGREKRCATYFGADGDRVTLYLHGQQLTSGQKRGEKIRKEPPPQIAEPPEGEIGGSSPLQNFFVDCDVTMTTRGDSL